MFGHIFTVLSLVAFGFCSKNVCRHFQAYTSLETSSDCWYERDLNSTPKEISENYGYKFDSYEVVTEDGFVLALFRVRSNGTSGGPVLLGHGLGVDAKAFMEIGRKSLPFILANSNFDVWLINFRGSSFSTKHMKYKTTDREYWDFGFHEMGIYDLPVTIDFINKMVDGKKIIFFGHSMGTTVSLVYAADKSKEAFEKLKANVALAPVAYMENARSAMKLLVPLTPMIKHFAESMNLYGIPVESDSKFCDVFPINMLCFIMYSLFSGVNEEEVVVERFPLVLHSGVLRGTSVKTLEHYGQLMASYNFNKFDYRSQNPQIYGTSQAPKYQLSDNKVPTYIFYGTKDFLADERDVLSLYHSLGSWKYIRKLRYSHGDFLVGRSAPKLFKFIVTLFQ